MPNSTTRPVSRRRERLEARLTREQKAIFQQAAELQGRTVTDFVLHSAHEAAMRTIEQSRLVRLNAEDSRTFADALLNPKKPTEKLRSAARRYVERFGD